MAKLAFPPVALTSQGAAIARVPRQVLLRIVRARAPMKRRMTLPGADGTDRAPASAVALLMKIFGWIGAAHNVSIIPLVTELSTVHAAAVLNVLRLFPLALLEKSQLPHWTVGKHRQVDMECYLLHGRHRQRSHGCSRSTCR